MIDANEILGKGEHPLAWANKVASSLEPNDSMMIKSDFRPEPLIDYFLEKGYDVFVKELESDNFLTYFRKNQ